jgi:hypothetical protein
MYFPHQTADAMAECILAFEEVESAFDPEVIRSHAQQFDTSLFRLRMRRYIDSALARAGRREEYAGPMDVPAAEEIRLLEAS